MGGGNEGGGGGGGLGVGRPCVVTLVPLKKKLFLFFFFTLRWSLTKIKIYLLFHLFSFPFVAYLSVLKEGGELE